jgi:hypothetical protein
MSSGSAGLEMGFIVGLDCITLRALLTLPLLFNTVFSAEVLLDAD